MIEQARQPSCAPSAPPAGQGSAPGSSRSRPWSGSSAITGQLRIRLASAMAIINRCRWPPDSRWRIGAKPRLGIAECPPGAAVRGYGPSPPPPEPLVGSSIDFAQLLFPACGKRVERGSSAPEMKLNVVAPMRAVSARRAEDLVSSERTEPTPWTLSPSSRTVDSAVTVFTRPVSPPPRATGLAAPTRSKLKLTAPPHKAVQGGPLPSDENRIGEPRAP